jgi:uncharacterized membrane protein
MTWNRRYQVKSYLRSALWIIPFVALPFEQVAWLLARTLDTRFAWKGLALGVTGAHAMFDAVITLTLSFIVFTFGSLLVAIQVASGQYTPRIIATTLLRDNVIRCTLGLFVFTLLFAIKAADRTETSVHQLVAFVTGLLGLICIVAFLFLIDYAARMLRPVSLVGRVGKYGLEVMESVYPEQSLEAKSIAGSLQSPGPVERTILHRGKSAIVVAANKQALVAEAEKAKGVIEFARKSAILLDRLNRCSCCTMELTPSTNGSCGHLSSWATSAQWSRTRSLRFAFLSILRSRHSQKRSMIQRPLCWRSISCTDFYEAREGGISGPIRSSIEPGNSA